MSSLGTDDPRLLTANDIKKCCKYWPVPSNEKWRVPMCKELIGVREGSLVLPGFDSSECEEILYHLCVS